MDMNAINNVTSSMTSASSTSSKAAKSSTAAEQTPAKESSAANTSGSTSKDGVVYERGSSTVNTEYVKKNAALIKQLKADSDARVTQLKNIVTTMMQKQGVAIGQSDDSIWKFLAGGDFTVDADTKAKAQADIAEDGYWGVEQTSDRIVDFAIALSGNDKEKADLMINAFKKGFSQATKSWGKTLPDISQRTYDAVMKKFDNWKNEDTTSSDTTTEQV